MKGFIQVIIFFSLNIFVLRGRGRGLLFLEFLGCGLCGHGLGRRGLGGRGLCTQANNQYQCAYCLKSFQRRDLMRKHEMIHTGGRGRGLRERGLPFLVLRGGGLIKVGSQIYINQNKSIVHTNKLGS